MKKIIALIALSLGVGFTASAQQKKATAPATVKTQTQLSDAEIAAAAKNDVASLNSVVTLTDSEKSMFNELFTTKYRNFREVSVPNASPDRKEIISQNIESKLRATLSADKMAKLDANPAVLKKITH
ncbi:hypothetical protein ACLI1A_08695 [Flavobacterium sp. RHBU_3]|uniref:hypothetical protein n=1 Tax=Flavobacterium sp. RHBU_3 TaxID=3391184 RepID=UPI003984DC03